MGGYDLYVDGNTEEDQSWVRLTATQKEEEYAQKWEPRNVYCHRQHGKRFQQHRKLDGRQESKSDRCIGNEEAEQLKA